MDESYAQRPQNYAYYISTTCHSYRATLTQAYEMTTRHLEVRYSNQLNSPIMSIGVLKRFLPWWNGLLSIAKSAGVKLNMSCLGRRRNLRSAVNHTATPNAPVVARLGSMNGGDRDGKLLILREDIVLWKFRKGVW